MRDLFHLGSKQLSNSWNHIILGGGRGLGEDLLQLITGAQQHLVRVTQEFNQCFHRRVCLIRSSPLS